MAIKYGLTADGFKRKRLPEIIQSLNDRVADKLGIEIQTGANSLFGQLHGVYGYEINFLWQLLEDTYNAMYPNTAQGIQLLNSAALAGIFQIAAESTSIVATCYGTDGATVPYNAQISSNDLTNAVYQCVDPDYKIESIRACDVEITVPTATAGTTYTLNIDGNSQTYTATATDDATIILTSLAAMFDFDDRTLTTTNRVLHITMNDQSLTFSVAVSNSLTISRLGSPFNFLCLTKGAINPAIGVVSNIITQYVGWDSVSNNMPANVGRDAETDIALRQRWDRSVYGRAYGMVDAISAAIYQTRGVTAVKTYENTGDDPDEYGRPPHCVEAVVSGGDPQLICNAIFLRKAAGIDTYGTISRTVYDSQGIPHTIYYNEPTEVLVWLHVEIDTSDAEGDFGGIQNVKKAIMDAAEKYEVGQDVILQKFYCPIYSTVTGIGYVRITATTGTTPGTYVGTNIEISPREIAVFDESRIEVAEV